VPTAGPTASAAAPPTPSATPTPVPTKPTLAQLVVSPDGLGDLVVGQAVPAEQSATAIMHYDPTSCADAANSIYSVGDPGAGAWLPSYPSDRSASHPLPFDIGPVAGPTDPVSVIEIWSSALKTDKGIGAGSTIAQLTAAYGSALSIDSAVNSDVYILNGARSKLLFEVANPADFVDPTQTGKVLWMHIVGLTASHLHFANGESGPCGA
jgi:hypothetical protein